MKRLNLLLCAVVATGLGFTSCSSDDDTITVNDDVQIAGTYRLTEVNTDSETDFNQDGTANLNQMNESNCYDNSEIIFNADNTFTYEIKSILVDETEGTSACNENIVSGTWVLQGGVGSTAIIDATYENPNGSDVTIRFNKEGNELTQYSLLTQYPDRDMNGGAVYSWGSVEMIFTKQ